MQCLRPTLTLKTCVITCVHYLIECDVELESNLIIDTDHTWKTNKLKNMITERELEVKNR